MITSIDTIIGVLKSIGLPNPVPEHYFHPTRRWRFDLAWPELKVAVERQGGTFTGGKHTRGAGYSKDREKINEAQLLGWLVIEITPDMIKSGLAWNHIEQAVHKRQQEVEA